MVGAAERTATVRMPPSLAARRPTPASPTATVSSAVDPALRNASSKMSGAGFRVLDGIELTTPSTLCSASSSCMWVFQLFVVFGAGDEPDFVAAFFERERSNSFSRKRMAATSCSPASTRCGGSGSSVPSPRLRRTPGSRVPVPLLTCLWSPDPRHPMASTLECPRPRLCVQVVRVHQRAVNVQVRPLSPSRLLSCLRIDFMKYSKGSQINADPNGLEGYEALREGAADVDRSDRKLLRLTGKDPIGMLNAVLTNDVPAQGDRGTYAMLLDPRVESRRTSVSSRPATRSSSTHGTEGAEAAKWILARYAPSPA